MYPLQTPRASLLKILPAIPPEFGPFKAKGGIRYSSYWATADEVCRSLFWFGDFDPWVDDTLRRLCRPGSSALDIGANIGATSIVMARAVGPSGKVFAFEPAPPNLAHLKNNLAANGLAWVTVEPIALSDRRAEIPMHFAEGRPGSSSLLKDGDGASFSVPCVPFDEWVGTNHPEGLDISVCKIDVEGHEAEVFAGMRATLARKSIASFVFEHHNSAPADPVFKMLRVNGYRIMRIEKNPLRTTYRDLEAPPSGRQTADFAAVIRDSEAEKRLLAP